MGQILTKNFQHALASVDLQTAKALVEAATAIADAGMASTDLATKRCCNALLQVADKFMENNEQIAQRFSENNMRMLQLALADLREHRVSLENLADRLSDDWRAEFRKASWTLGTASILSGVVTALVVVLGLRLEAVVAALINAFLWLYGIGELRIVDASSYIIALGIAWKGVHGLGRLWCWMIDINLRTAKAEMEVYILSRQMQRQKGSASPFWRLLYSSQEVHVY
jgi:hypothetical protein